MPLDSVTTQTTQVIIDAMEYLNKYGWCQDMAQLGGQMCLWGALRDAAGVRRPDLLNAACRRVALANDILDDNLPAWNDVPGRTKRQVIEALEKAL